MGETERQWIELLTKAYPKLHNSELVMHTSKESDKKIDRVARFLRRLDIVHNKVSQSKRKSDELFLKELYYKLYIIKEENIPESYYKSQARIARERGYGDIEITDLIRHSYAQQIIEDQKASLDKWIEYFLYDEESASYEMWEKYWVFQGIINLGKYDKETGKFKKRDFSTIITFPDLNREAVFTTLKLMEDYIKDKKSYEEIKSALGNGNFKILYEYSINQLLIKGKNRNLGAEGKWVKYDQGSDYHKLRDSLQGYYTGWCTAAGENFAKTQLEDGDFYVYYSNDKYGEAKIPRLAIRMDGNYKIAEVRGIADDQNVESEMLPILEKKLREFPDSVKYYKKESDMRRLTEIDNKVKSDIDLSIDELKFLYELEDTIEGFGFGKDPRLEEIKNKRNTKRDYALIYNSHEDRIALSKEEYFKSPEKFEVLIGGFYLNSLTSTEGLRFPKILTGDLYLNGVLSVDDETLPEIVLGSLELRGLETTEGLRLPKSVGVNLRLNSIRNAETLELPETIGGSLNLESLVSVVNLKLPKIINGSVDLPSLTTFENLELPDTVGKSLFLNSLTSVDGLKLPKIVGGLLDLRSLTSVDGLKFPEVVRSIDLRNLKTKEGLKLPIGFNLDNLICPEDIKQEIINNPELYYQTDNYDVSSQESLIKSL